MGWRRPPLPVHLERVPRWFIERVKDTREPPEPRRRRLGLSEAECQQKLRPARRLLVGASGLTPDWRSFNEHIDREMAEKKWIELPRDDAA